MNGKLRHSGRRVRPLTGTLRWLALGVGVGVFWTCGGAAAAAMAQVDVVTELVRDAQVPANGYSSAEAAAASNRFNPDSVARDREHVGGILRCAGGYYYTHGVARQRQSPVMYSVNVPPNCVSTALWHTHGSSRRNREYFSEWDTRSADALGKPMYMANHLGELRVYRPGVRYRNRVPGSSIVRPPSGVTTGDLVRMIAVGKVAIATR